MLGTCTWPCQSLWRLQTDRAAGRVVVYIDLSPPYFAEVLTKPCGCLVGFNVVAFIILSHMFNAQPAEPGHNGLYVLIKPNYPQDCDEAMVPPGCTGTYLQHGYI